MKIADHNADCGASAEFRALDAKIKYLLIVLLLLGAAVRIWVAFRPIEELEYKTIPDDSFYYFQTARHIVAGNGSTFDGVERHNGYHPLWMGLILPVYATIPGDMDQPGSVGAIRAVLTIGALLDVATAFLLFIIVLSLTGSSLLGMLAILLHLFDPYAILHSVEGLETPLLGLMLAVVFWVSKDLLMGGRVDMRKALSLGVALGLLMLSRTDSVFFAGALLIVLLFTVSGGMKSRLGLVLSGAVASILVFPWLLFGKLYVGTWGQTSSLAGPYVLRMHFQTAHGPLYGVEFWNNVSANIENAAAAALDLSPMGYLVLPFFAAAVVYAVVKKIGLVALFIAPVFYCVALLEVHAGWRWMLRPWYYAPLYLFMCPLVPLMLHLLFGKRRGSRDVVAVLLGITMAFFFGLQWIEDWNVGLWPGQAGGVEAARLARKYLPEGVKIGSTDAGMVGYFGPPGLVNLDGVVNESARRAIKEGKLLQYCFDEGINVAGFRQRMRIPEIMGDKFQLYMYPGPLGYEELREYPWAAPQRFVVPGGIIKMGERQYRKYLLSGWSFKEYDENPDHIWAVSEKADLAITIPKGVTRIDLTIKPFPHEKYTRRSIGVMVDEIVVSSFNLEEGWRTISVPVPEREADGNIHIVGFRFDPPPEYAQMESGMCPDYRKPAVAFRMLKLINDSGISGR